MWFRDSWLLQLNQQFAEDRNGCKLKPAPVKTCVSRRSTAFPYLDPPKPNLFIFGLQTPHAKLEPASLLKALWEHARCSAEQGIRKSFPGPGNACDFSTYLKLNSQEAAKVQFKCRGTSDCTGFMEGLSGLGSAC